MGAASALKSRLAEHDPIAPIPPYCLVTGRFMMQQTTLSRRALLAGATLLVAGTAKADDTDVVIIGAGAAGVGAARELKRLGKSFILLEARERAGGRVFTDLSLGQPVDMGAAYIHFAETNPWSAIAQEAGIDPLGGYRLWGGAKAFRSGIALDDVALAARLTALRKVPDVYDDIEEREDVSLAQALRAQDRDVQDAGRIQAQMAAGEDPEWVSVSDWQRLEGGQNRLVPGGYGSLVAKAAEALSPRLGVKVVAVDWSGSAVIVTTDKGPIRARKVIVTVPIGVLKAGHIRFTPALPLDAARALDGLKMGALSKIVLRFDKERFGFIPHQFLAEIGDPTRAMTFETWPFDHDVIMATLGGSYARGIAQSGEVAAVDHALERLTKITGNDVRKHFKGGRLAGWTEDPFSLGAYAVALPGRMRSREALAKPFGERLWFAGEATAGVYSMTAGGAYLAGRDAAKQAAAKLSTGSIR
jgi:monoamine oxidase